MERPRVLASTRQRRRAARSPRLQPAAADARARRPACSRVAPAAFALRGGDLAAYHGAEHVSIGTYEHGESRPKEHERCGSHLIGPMLAHDRGGQPRCGACAEYIRPAARVAYAIGSLAASVEIFNWMTRNAEHPLSRALAKPGHESSTGSATREPSRRRSSRSPTPRCGPACSWKMESRRRVATHQRLHPGVFDLPVEKMQAGWYTDAYFNHTRATLIEDGRHPDFVMQVFQKRRRVPRRDGRGDRDPQTLRGHVLRPDRARAL